MSYPNILTIAGSDSGGGAGIQADIKAITSLGGFAVSVITALTAQNGNEVQGVFSCPGDFVVKQYKAICDGFTVKSAKTGMLFNCDVINSISPYLKKRSFPLVVDPVCISQSGFALMEKEAIEAIKTTILPIADIITPNIPEAEELSGVQIKTEDDVVKAGKILQKLGATYVLIKGGHFFDEQSKTLTDWLFMENNDVIPLSHSRIYTNNNHGTGCTLSAAIAYFLGSDKDVLSAVKSAQKYLLRALEYSFSPGIGAGPVNFLAGAGKN